ncbi:OsmC family protein [Pontibacter sp. BT731]|uniref:OsmC family protein n=1 Tax=Pontibacter coccineus TaxID=3063328 RepID=UPI0026E213D6|nr:OsmC family protein [Pontibacter sp. BT731]MDO6388588.1 OsmC family protein [Pontibacter sp. BT731]
MKQQPFTRYRSKTVNCQVFQGESSITVLTTNNIQMPNIIATAEAENTGEAYATKLITNQHRLLADEPFDLGGQNLGPNPGDYLCMALASCMVITLRMYITRKGWEIGRIKAKVNLVKSTNTASGNNTFYCSVSFGETLTTEQRGKLCKIAKACPLHRLLSRPSDIITLLD